jgi:RNase P/RNase MRP subunit p29
MTREISIFIKDGYISYLAVAILDKPDESIVGIVGKMSEKESGALVVKPFDDRKECLTAYQNAVKVTLERGWVRSWVGKPNYG